MEIVRYNTTGIIIIKDYIETNFCKLVNGVHEEGKNLYQLQQSHKNIF